MEATLEHVPTIPDVKQTIDDAKKAEYDSIMSQTEIDRGWYPVDSRFLVKEADKEGVLIKVPHEGEHYQLIGRLRGPDKYGTPPEPDEALPSTFAMMKKLFGQWAEKMKSEGLDPVLYRLAITSLYRDESLQTALSTAEGAYFAAPPRVSSHLAGGAFDIDPNGDYKKNTDGKYVSEQNSSPEFNPRVIELLFEVLTEEHKKNNINLVVENKIIAKDNEVTRVPTVYHVCVNPAATE